ncbi:MAG: sugar-binding protein [Clostridiales bacterium]|jgi:putative multiple sugar transport system substrate-binding protein|nr:sugar-binding protein [Clostridiales bacterium]
MKKAFSLLLAALLIVGLAACASPTGDTPAAGGDAVKIGVSMPTQSLQRWNQDGANMKEQLEAAGYEVDLQYAGDNDIPTQINQIENMISNGCSVLVIAAIDDSSLTQVLEGAKENDVKVIAYDRLIKNTDAVSYYATFDNWLVGTTQGNFLKDRLDLENAEGPFNIELFTGDPGDNNINYFFGGAMEVLTPYIEEGKLVVLSGEIEQAVVATPQWNTEESQKRMENLIAAYGYGPDGTQLDAVLSSNDSVANGITNALVAAGYTAENFPLITGQDCDITSTKNMIAGIQAMSVFKDTRILAATTLEMIEAIVNGTEVPINNTTDYDNGIFVVPTFLCEPVFADINNYEELLIESGYYTLDQLQ